MDMDWVCRTPLLYDRGESLDFFEIECKVKNHLNFLADIVVVVIAVHVPFELSAISNNLLPLLLKGDFHVLARSASHVGPEGSLPTVSRSWRRALLAHAAPVDR